MIRSIMALVVVVLGLALSSCDDDQGPGRPSQVTLDFPLKVGTTWTYTHSWTRTAVSIQVSYVGVYTWTLTRANTSTLPSTYVFSVHGVDQVHETGYSGEKSYQAVMDDQFTGSLGKDTLTIEWGPGAGMYEVPETLEKLPLLMWSNQYRRTQDGYDAVFERGRGLVSFSWSLAGTMSGSFTSSLALRSVVIPP